MHFVLRPLLQIGLIFKLLNCGYCSSPEGKVWEYCDDENFNPVCSNDEVAIMQSARYGHIKLGRCVDADLGSLGCFVDQLSVLDRMCSGKQSCDIDFGSSDMEGEFPCELKRAFVRYLEASFICVKVFQNQGKCQGQTEVSVNSRTTYLSSTTTTQTGCGAESKPWVLKAREGQTINITFIDFMWKYHSREESEIRCPVQYGYILDLVNNGVVYLCGGLVRERSIYVSEGSSVQVMFDTDVINDVRFLIGYQAIGCPDYKPPPNTWVEEEDGRITVGCVGGTKKWHMQCIGTYWLGPQRDCQKVDDEMLQVKSAQSASEDSHFLGMSHVVASALFGGLAVIIASIIITVGVGIFCIRKPRKKCKGDVFFSPGDGTIPQLIPVDTFPTYKSVQVKLPKQRSDSSTPGQFVGSENTMSSVGSIPRYPAPVSQRDSPHYYLLEGRDLNDTEPLYDVVYQGLPTDNSV